MNNLVVIPNKKEDIKNILKKDIHGLILGIKGLSIYPLELDIEEIIEIANNTNKEITVAMNKMIHNKDLSLVREVLGKIKNSKIKKIMFYDLGIFNICKNMHIDKELILSEEHLNASISSNKFYYDNGIKNTFITSDITYEELLEIKNNTKMNIYYTVYGYLPIFYSRRYLLTNYFKYINKEMKDDTYYIFNKELRYMIKEYNYGTIIYSPLINLINEVDKIKDIDNLVIDLSYTDDIVVIDKFINNESMDNTYIGFFNKKTIYKLKDEKQSLK